MPNINRRNFLKIIGAGMASSGLALSNCSDNFRKRNPNIIYILADDLGYGDVTCLNSNSKIPTPNLDRLAAEGIKFIDSHSGSAVCTPTRYGILTGRYCWRTRLKRSVLEPWAPPLIEKNRLTVPSFLKQHGYRTACIGKWHLGWDWPSKDGNPVKSGWGEPGLNVDFTCKIANGPTTRGFDYYFGVSLPNFPPYCFIENDQTIGIPTIEKSETMFSTPGLMVEGWDLRNILPALEKKSVEYIEKYAHDNYPFFLYLPLTAPHTPIAPTKDHQGKSQAGTYGDFVHQVDAVVGRIMQTLDKNGLSNNTLLIFTSDNGSPGRDGTNMAGPVSSVRKYGHNSSYIYRGIKADIWEGGHRIPFFARWPQKIKPGSQSDEIICLTDLLATCAAIVNGKLPENAGEDSYNILPAMLGDDYQKPIREATVHHSSDGMFSIRQGPWKLIDGQGSGGWSKGENDSTLGQLYYLEHDFSEKNNLYNEYPQIVRKLKELLEKYKREGKSAPVH